MSLKQLISLKFLLLIFFLFTGYPLFEKASEGLYTIEALLFGLYILFASLMVNIINDKIDKIKRDTKDKGGLL